MGTRVDFYVGRGQQAEWLGSYPYDGYPDGIDAAVLAATEESEFRKAVADFLGGDNAENATLPEQGWPWPWDDSRTTDYSYAFDGGKTWASCYGHKWFDPLGPQPEMRGAKEVFPDMKDRKNVTLGPRSGVIVLGIR